MPLPASAGYLDQLGAPTQLRPLQSVPVDESTPHEPAVQEPASLPAAHDPQAHLARIKESMRSLRAAREARASVEVDAARGGSATTQTQPGT